eukprot:215144-Chlamydomonas_euryale.AAC.5
MQLAVQTPASGLAARRRPACAMPTASGAPLHRETTSGPWAAASHQPYTLRHARVAVVPRASLSEEAAAAGLRGAGEADVVAAASRSSVVAPAAQHADHLHGVAPHSAERSPAARQLLPCASDAPAALGLLAALLGAAVAAPGAADAAVAVAAGAQPMASVADLTATQAASLEAILRPVFALYTLLYVVRIPMTWYPNIDTRELPWLLVAAPTDPFMKATRKVVPLVGGVDVTPIVLVSVVSFFNEILLGPQGILMLIQR